MLPFQQRVVEEKKELDDKLQKLSLFFDTPVYASLDSAEQERLQKQEVAMITYSEILGDRIRAF